MAAHVGLNTLHPAPSGNDIPLQVVLTSEHATAPMRATAGAAGFDLYSAEAAILEPGKRKLFRTDLKVSVGPGRYGRIAPRSGLAIKQGIDTMAGVIDADYTGLVGVALVNLGQEPFEVAVGDRIAQLVLEVIHRPDVEVVPHLDKTARGADGFGSTGK